MTEDVQIYACYNTNCFKYVIKKKNLGYLNKIHFYIFFLLKTKKKLLKW